MVALAAACAVAAPAAAQPSGRATHARKARTTHVSRARHLTRAQLLDFAWPAQGTITRGFSTYHHGLDIGMLHSLAVTAAAPGKVLDVGETTGFEGYGNIVEVRHGRYEELYAHLSAYRVKVGQKVWAGEHIATAGCTGSCTGTHLHFEVRVNGVAVSPLGTVLRPLVALRPLEHRPLLTSRRPSFARFVSRL